MTCSRLFRQLAPVVLLGVHLYSAKGLACNQEKPINNTGSPLTVSAYEGCRTYRVLPPENQPTTTHEVTYINQDLCQHVRSWAQMAKKVSHPDTEFYEKLRKTRALLEQQTQVVEQWSHRQTEILSELKSLPSSDDVSWELERQQEKLALAQERLQDCWFCKDDEKDASDAETRIEELRRHLAKEAKLSAELEQLANKQPQLIGPLVDVYKKSQKLRVLIDRTQKLMAEAAQPYLDLQGAQARISYESRWSDTLVELQSNNEQQFELARIIDANFWLAVIDERDAQSIYSGWPATDPLTEEDVTIAYEDHDYTWPEYPRIEYHMWPENIEGHVEVNLLAACQMAQSDRFSLQLQGTYVRNSSLPGPHPDYKVRDDATDAIVKNEFSKSGFVTLSLLNHWADHPWRDLGFQASFYDKKPPEDWAHAQIRAIKMRLLRRDYLVHRMARLAPVSIPFDEPWPTDTDTASGNNYISSLCAQRPFVCVTGVWWGEQMQSPSYAGSITPWESRSHVFQVLQPHLYRHASSPRAEKNQGALDVQ